MEIKMCCIKCGEKLSFSNWGNVRDVNNKPIGCCKYCSKDVLTELKSQRYVETYKGNNIYILDGKYAPYWGCNYCFDNIDDCRASIDNSNVAIIPMMYIELDDGALTDYFK